MNVDVSKSIGIQSSTFYQLPVPQKMQKTEFA